MKQSIDLRKMMNLVADDRFTETRDFSGQFMVLPAGFGKHESGQNALSRLSREQLAAFLNAESSNLHGAHFSTPRIESPPPAAEKGLAVGVLKQAAYDLRRFRDATKGANREFYLDAYSWITAHDFSWPYSFMNVCKLLDLCPEVVREELLAEASLGSFHYWIRRANRFSRKLGTSFVRVFASGRSPESVEASQFAPSV
jgi:hypothetical protein